MPFQRSRVRRRLIEIKIAVPAAWPNGRMQLQISFRGLPPSDALQQAIAERAAKLEHFYERIASCRVVVEVDGRHKRHGREYAVRIDLKVPGGELAITHERNEDAQVAMRDAFDAVRRKLEDYARTQRGDVKRHSVAKGS